MFVLCGFPLSNYYNKVKLALLEKGVPFTEEGVGTGEPAKAGGSPLGKVPFARTEHGVICESEALMDYIETRWPTPALLPADPWQRAKVRELTIFLDLHLELVARELYGQAFFGGTTSEKNRERVRTLLDKHLAGFKQLAQFSPYVAGDSFTQADCAAYVHLPLVALATKAVLGEDLVAAHGIDWKAYVKLIGERESARKVAADRKADQERRLAAKSS
jgi:glutathione S-transferase